MSSTLTSLIAILEKSQTHKDVDANTLFKELTPAEAALDGQTALEPGMRQKLVSALCSWLRAHEDFPDGFCLRAVVKLLAKLLGEDMSVDTMAIQKGLISSMTTLLKTHPADALMVKCCLEVLATLSVVESSDKIIQDKGSVQAVVELLQKHRGNPIVLEDAITALALMARRTRHRRSLSQGNGIATMVDILKRHLGSPSLVVAVCRFLCNFAVKEEGCLTVLQNGGVQALMVAFDNPVPQGQQSAAASPQVSFADTRSAIASAIWACCAECSEVQDTLLSSGWLSSLASVLQSHPDHDGIHEAALGIVRSLSRARNYREDIVSLGFIPVTVEAMRKFSSNKVLLKEACGMLGNLATDAEIRVTLGESGAVQEVVATLAQCTEHDDRKVAKLALGALSNLSNLASIRDTLATTEVVPILLRTMQVFMNNENILDYAIGVLSHLAVHEVMNQQLLQAGAAEALLLFVGEHREDLQVISKSLVALRRLLKTSVTNNTSAEGVVMDIASAGRADGAQGVRLLVEAMQAHVYDETVVKETALLLTSLSRVPANIQPLMSIAVEPCMKAMEVHKNDLPVADAVAGLLAQLPLEEDEQWAKETSLSLDSPDLLARQRVP
eukprot:gnl/TRDRNA2_/TRDRNA2_82580_c0_seq1.p1 gnl/TRDRNA2_/TRDRNA2_82580_c0~~gnl/TRDRNA2_/TRDRNA2_82580_c0_seq1.p1  ORF type:complete len:613 (+),score=136.95 gnl/TRDRNA2_/TRDRNA2_82580_c0_seq1:44-1882(+)